MLKGYTKIELTDVHTGEKDVVEKHNLITNNLAKLTKHYMLNVGFKDIRGYLCPLYEKALGGIVLLSDAIDENPDSYHIAYTSKDMLTGCASNTVNSGTDIKVGSKNLTESKAVENGYQLVWDFGTSQANGTISALGLVPYYVSSRSEYAYAYPSYNLIYYFTQQITNLYRYLVEYDFEQNIATLIRTVDASTVNVTRYKFDLTTIHLNDSDTGNIRVLNVLDKNVTSSLELDARGFWLDGFDGYYYYVNLSSLTQQYIARMKKDTLQIDTSYGLTEINLDLYDPNVLYEVNACQCCAIANGYLYAPGSANYSYNKVNLSDLSKIEKVQNSANINYCSVASDGSLIYTNGNVIFPDDSFVHYNIINNGNKGGFIVGDNNRTQKTIISNKGKVLWVEYGDYNCVQIAYFLNNLNTINNLETPVTKTADKTMKITYTITEE